MRSRTVAVAFAVGMIGAAGALGAVACSSFSGSGTTPDLDAGPADGAEASPPADVETSTDAGAGLRLYVIGGRTAAGDKTAAILSAPVLAGGKLGPWEVSSIALPQAIERPSAAALRDTFVVAAGDWADPATSAVVFHRDGAALTKSPATLAFPARTRQSGFVAGDRFYVVGGSAGALLADTWFTTIEDPSRAWLAAPAAALPDPRSNHASTSADGFVYVGGGIANTGAGQGPNATLWVARVGSAGALSPWATSALRSAKADHQMVTHGGYLFVIGGSSLDVLSPDPKAEVSTVKLGADGGLASAWGLTSDVPPSGRTGHGAVVVGDYLYVLGGRVGAALAADVKVGHFDANGNVEGWVDTTPLPAPLAFFAAVAF